MPARDVHHWIDRWERTGLVDATVAQTLHDDATRAGATPPLVEPDPVDRVLQAARSGVVEALGYVGAALTLGAVVVLFDVPTWPQPALAAVLALAAVVAGVGVWRLTPPHEDAGRRLAGVLGAVSVAATAGALVVALVPEASEDVPRGRELVVAVPTLAVAVTLYRRHAHLLTHVALGGAAAATCVALAVTVVGPQASFEAEQSAIGGLLLVVAVVWVAANEAGRLAPPWFGTPAAGAVAYAGAAMAVTWVEGGDAEVIATLVTALVATGAAVATSRLRVLVVGVAGLVVTVPMTFTELLGWTPTATAGLLLPVGVAVTAWAVWAGRRPAARG